MQKQTALWTFAALLLGAGAGVAGTRLATSGQDDQVLRELRSTRELLGVLAQRDTKSGAAPALTTIIQTAAAERVSAPERRASTLEKPAPEAQPEPTPENWAAYETAERLVSAAVASGRWSNQNEHQLRVLGSKMTHMQIFELNRAIVRAVNEDKLVRESYEPHE
jgi:hypothetical protein